MLKRDITYTNFEGETVTETFYFNMTKAELVEMELSERQGFSETLKAIVSASDGGKIIEYFKKIILMAYGERSADGKRFIKTQEAAQAFASTEAYSELFMELATDADAASAFVNGIMPAVLLDEVRELPPTVIETHSHKKDPTEMTKDELLALLSEKS